MEEKKWNSDLGDTLLGFVCGAVACALLSGVLPRYDTETPIDNIVTRDTVRDTITVRKPVVMDRMFVKTVVRELPVVRDTLFAPDINVTTDTASVEIPITQKTYSDSLYDAWVSGYEAKLDSIRIKRETVVITKRVPKRWGIGVQAGVGPPGAYVGIGITYNILSF